MPPGGTTRPSKMANNLFVHNKNLLLKMGPSIFAPDFYTWDPSKPDDLKLPICEEIVDLVKGNFPYGMGSFAWGSSHFMIGGEYAIRKPGTLDYVFLVDPSSPFLVSTNAIPNLKAGRARPIVVSIKGKVFMLESSGPLPQRLDQLHPVFEYFDTKIGNWEPVVDVPYVTTDSDGSIDLPPYTALGSFVIGSKLFIPCGAKELHCFDANTMGWDAECSLNLLQSFNDAGFLQTPMFGRCASVSGFDGYYLMVCLQDFGNFKCQKPYAHLIDKTGKLVFHQDLSETDNMLADFLPNAASAVQSRFIDLGNGKMCGVFYGQDKGKIDIILHVCIFELQKVPGAVDDISSTVKKFVSVKILHKYFCKLTGLCEFKKSPLVNAFFL